MAQAQGSTSMPPPTPKSGQSALVYLRELRRWAQKNTITPGKGLYSTQTASGRTLNVKINQQAQTLVYPWALISQDGSGNITLEPGVVNTRMSTIGGTRMDAATPPTIAVTGNGVIYAELTTNEYEVTDDEAEIAFAAATPADTATKRHVTIHYVSHSTDGSTVTVKTTASRTTHLWAIIAENQLIVGRA